MVVSNYKLRLHDYVIQLSRIRQRVISVKLIKTTELAKTTELDDLYFFVISIFSFILVKKPAITGN